MINKVTLLGRLGQDPETRTTNSGSTVATLSLATSHRVKDGEEWKEQTEWHRVVCFGNMASNAARYLTKGRQVYIEGRIQTRKWQDKDGNDRWSTEIIANEIKFLGDNASSSDDTNNRNSKPTESRESGKRGNGGSGKRGNERDSGRGSSSGEDYGNTHGQGSGYMDDDIPF